ncbi:MAG: membrane protein insertion efficiency factor YidD [Bifidobacteriaceae bacterium]|jgi:putative membrane protein insertion efficiency factor|nr:membrane protein insertion efficiency factor YidD [Bifidobacteriaceae bacterium]
MRARGGEVIARAGRLPAAAVVSLIRAYQRWISPVSGPRCRFYPSCSQYAVTALSTHGLIKGAGLALWRLAKCQPFNAGGVDYVPAKARLRWRGHWGGAER